jgi:hypothetical protein
MSAVGLSLAASRPTTRNSVNALVLVLVPATFVMMAAGA